MSVDDQQTAHDSGKISAMPAEKLLVIACGMIAREVQGVVAELGITNIDLTCLPAGFHHRPAKIAPAMERAIKKAKKKGYTRIFAGYADCGTQGALDKVLEQYGIERIEGPHCFSFYIGNQRFIDRDDSHLTHFFMTDFLARHFKTFLVEPLGLERHPDLKEMYFGNYTHLHYIAQTEDISLQNNAKEAAKFLGLHYSYEFTGYGDLGTALTQAAG
ncbi:MAG: DUF1638 domain-containing protein [Notoacmeibacter sp.]